MFEYGITDDEDGKASGMEERKHKSTRWDHMARAEASKWLSEA